MVVFEPFEELYFAKVKGRENYAFLHSFFDGKVLSPEKSRDKANLNYNEFCLYLAGACFGKDDKRLHLYNGVSPNIAGSVFHKIELVFLDKDDLEKLLLDIKLENNLKESIKTID